MGELWGPGTGTGLVLVDPSGAQPASSPQMPGPEPSVSALVPAGSREAAFTYAIIAAGGMAVQRAVAERCGFEFETILRERLFLEGERYGMCIFSKINS